MLTGQLISIFTELKAASNCWLYATSQCAICTKVRTINERIHAKQDGCVENAMNQDVDSNLLATTENVPVDQTVDTVAGNNMMRRATSFDTMRMRGLGRLQSE